MNEIFLRNEETGEVIPFGGATEISFEPTIVDIDFEPFYEENVGIEMKLDKMNKKTLQKIFALEKWQATVLLHPRKKNRGLRRRMKRFRR